MSHGEFLLKEVYESLRAGPNWNDTVLIITYDEHGGLYDHVPPPSSAPNPDGINSTLSGYEFNFDRLGIRVPFIVVSPRVQKGVVYHEPAVTHNHYEHSSVMKTVRRWLKMNERPLTKREAWAASFEDVLSLSTPRTDCPMTLPIASHAQPLWKEYQRARKIRDWSKYKGPIHPAALRLQNDLHIEVTRLASRSIDPEEEWVSEDELATWTQQQGSEFLQRQITKFLNKKR